MRTTFARLSVALAATLPFVSACSTAATTIPLQPRRANTGLRFVDPSRVADLYVSQFRATFVNAYRARDRHNAGPHCTIAGIVSVNSIGVDASGTLWVPQQDNNGGAQSIASFGPHCGVPGVVLKDPYGFPAAIAFDSKDTRYVMNVQDYPSAAGDVAVFPKGTTTPTARLTHPAFTLLTAIGVDANDNVYVMYGSGSDSGAIVEFHKGKMPGRRLRLRVPGYPGGTLLFDRAGNLVADDLTSLSVDVFAPPFGRTLRRFHVKGLTWQCSLNAAQTKLACADYGNGSVDVYAYPDGAYQHSITKGLEKVRTVAGAAFDPR